MVYKCSKKGGPMPPGGVVTPPGHGGIPPDPDSYEYMQLSDLQTQLTGKASRQVWIKVEKYADGIVIPGCLAGLMGDIDGTVQYNINRGPYNGEIGKNTESVTDAGAGGSVSVTHTPAANEKWLVLGYWMLCNNGADMSDLRIFQGAGPQFTSQNGETLKNNVYTPALPVYWDGTSYLTLTTGPIILTNTYTLRTTVTVAASKTLNTYLYYLKFEG